MRASATALSACASTSAATSTRGERNAAGSCSMRVIAPQPMKASLTLSVDCMYFAVEGGARAPGIGILAYRRGPCHPFEPERILQRALREPRLNQFVAMLITHRAKQTLTTLLLAAFLAVIFAGSAAGAIVRDATALSVGTNTTFTYAHTIGVGMDRVLIVGVSCYNSNKAVTA